jgi:hypothetical protein
LNYLVEVSRRPVQHLPIAFSAEQNVIDITANQRLILLGMLLRGLFERQALHDADASFSKSFCLDYRKVCSFGKWFRGLYRALEVA